MMKKLMLSAMCALALVSCSDKAKLASQLEGSWSGAPERLAVSDAAVASMTPTYSFTLADGNSTGGDVTIAAMVSATLPIKAPMDAMVLPFQVTVSAIATVEGTWSVTDDDEVALILNFQTMTVNVNPDAVTAADDALTDETVQLFEKTRPALAKQVQQTIGTAVETRFMAMHGLQDVEIKNNDLLEYEIGHHKLYMHRTN